MEVVEVVMVVMGHLLTLELVMEHLELLTPVVVEVELVGVQPELVLQGVLVLLLLDT